MDPGPNTTIAVTSVFFGTATLFVTARLLSYLRARRREDFDVIKKALRSENLSTFASLCFFLWFCGCQWVAAASSINDPEDGRAEFFRSLRKSETSQGMASYTCALVLARNVTVVYFTRLWQPLWEKSTFTLLSVSLFHWVNALWPLVSTFTDLGMCVRYSNRRPDDVPERCSDRTAFITSIETFNFILSLWLLVIAYVGLKARGLNRQLYLELSIPFAIGVFICAISIVQISISWSNLGPGEKLASWGVWRAVQIGLTIVCACLGPARSML